MGHDADRSGTEPLPDLLRSVLADLQQVYIEEGTARRGMPPLDLWANLLRVLDASGSDLRELPATLRLSRRAARTRVAGAIRHGWLEETKSGRGQATVKLTARGLEAVERWRLLQGAAEERWCGKVGVGPAGRLRAALEQAVAALPLEHPHYPASYGPADASITGGNGHDWKSVWRAQGDTVTELPLVALISQALVAYAMRYEGKSAVAFTLSSVIVQRIPGEGLPMKALGPSAGLSALVRHGFVHVSGKKAFLTPRGLAVSRAHDECVKAVEEEWRKEIGEERVLALRDALEGVSEAQVLFAAREGQGAVNKE